MKITSLILLLVFTVSPEWLIDFDTAKTSASQSGKHILLNFSGSDWCAPCIKLKKEVFETSEFAGIVEKNLVLLRADFPRSKKNQLSKEQVKHNELLAEKYNPNGKFPLTLLLNDKGNVLKEWDGYVYGSQDKFLSELKATLSSR